MYKDTENTVKCSLTRRTHGLPARHLGQLGRTYGKFLRLLYSLSHRQTVQSFDTFGEEPSSYSNTASIFG